MQAHAKTADSNYPEPPKYGSLKNGEKLISDVLLNNLSVAENGRELWWRLSLEEYERKGLQMSQREIISHYVQLYTNILVLALYATNTNTDKVYTAP